MTAGTGDVQPAIARMELRLTALETELREATGRSEEISYRLDQINQRLEKLVGDVDFRLNQLEKAQAETQARQQGGGGAAATAPNVAAVPAPQRVQRGGSGQDFAKQPGTLGTLSGSDLARLQEQQGEAAPTTTATASTAPAPAAPAETRAEQAAATPGVLPEGTPEEQYAYAFGLLRQARYDEAEVALRAFVNAHADHKLTENAKYWLGETFYVRADYVQAAEIFLDAYQADQTGPKAPDTLLKLGMSLANLDKKKEACAAFGKLAGEYPDAPSNIKRVVAREQQKYGCQ
jgi:tol-pal system protein YbgF